jgi:hypothetical protein
MIRFFVILTIPIYVYFKVTLIDGISSIYDITDTKSIHIHVKEIMFLNVICFFILFPTEYDNVVTG